MEPLHWSEIVSNLGSVFIGLGTLALAVVGFLANKTYKAKHKDPNLSKKYEKLAYTMFREVEHSDITSGGRLDFPGSIPKLVADTAKRFGCPEEIVRDVLDDVIKEGYFRYFRGNANVEMKLGVGDDGNIEHKPDKLV